jgi:AcrR family transcriptional regulator
MPRPPGRPRQFDPESALKQARTLFWRRGYSAASLDGLASAMGINRPSLYAAFGDKEALFRAALVQFAGEMRSAAEAVITQKKTPQDALLSFYRGAIAVYTSENQPRGCFVFSTAIAECPEHPEIQHLVAALMIEIDALCARLVGPDLAQLAATILHGLSARARAGTPRAALEAIAEVAVERLFQPTAPAAPAAKASTAG